MILRRAIAYMQLIVALTLLSIVITALVKLFPQVRDFLFVTEGALLVYLVKDILGPERQ